MNNEDDHEWCDRLNNWTVVFVFIILIVNVFVSSFGVDVMNPGHNLPANADILNDLPRTNALIASNHTSILDG